jgi:hypothetical protein
MLRRRHRPPSFAVTWPSAREISAKLKGETRPDTSRNYACRCPGPMHKNGDTNPSPSLKDGKNGRPVLHCHAGCDFRDIVAELERMGVLHRSGR